MTTNAIKTTLLCLCLCSMLTGNIFSEDASSKNESNYYSSYYLLFAPVKSGQEEEARKQLLPYTSSISGSTVYSSSYTYGLNPMAIKDEKEADPEKASSLLKVEIEKVGQTRYQGRYGSYTMDAIFLNYQLYTVKKGKWKKASKGKIVESKYTRRGKILSSIVFKYYLPVKIRKYNFTGADSCPLSFEVKNKFGVPVKSLKLTCEPTRRNYTSYDNEGIPLDCELMPNKKQKFNIKVATNYSKFGYTSPLDWKNAYIISATFEDKKTALMKNSVIECAEESTLITNNGNEYTQVNLARPQN